MGRPLGPALAVPLPAAESGGQLREHQVVTDLRTLERHLRVALESRAVIDQAKGIVMSRLGCDADEAFATLVEASQASNVKLRRIAAQLVAEVSSGRPQQGPEPGSAVPDDRRT